MHSKIKRDKNILKIDRCPKPQELWSAERSEAEEGVLSNPGYSDQSFKKILRHFVQNDQFFALGRSQSSKMQSLKMGQKWVNFASFHAK